MSKALPNEQEGAPQINGGGLLVPREGETKPIHLTVVKILAYGHELDELPAPTSAQLFLQGEGAEELALGVFIFYNE